MKFEIAVWLCNQTGNLDGVVRQDRTTLQRSREHPALSYDLRLGFILKQD